MIPAPSLFAEPSRPRALYGLSVINSDLAEPKQRTKNQHLVFVVVIYVCALALQGLLDSLMGWLGYNQSRDFIAAERSPLNHTISITHTVGVISGKHEPSIIDN